MPWRVARGAGSSAFLGPPDPDNCPQISDFPRKGEKEGEKMKGLGQTLVSVPETLGSETLGSESAQSYPLGWGSQL